MTVYQPKKREGGFEQHVYSTIKHTVLTIEKTNALIRLEVWTKAGLSLHLQKDSPKNTTNSSA